MRKTAIFLIFLTTICFSINYSVAEPQSSIRIALLAQPMPDFTLPSHQGKEIRLSEFKGKNIMLIFPRGYAAPERWCTICHYKYLELVEMEARQQLRKKYNLEIIFILPYSKEVVNKWLEDLPAQIDKIKKWKYPENFESLDEKGRQSVERYRKLFPKDLNLKDGKIPAPFPILIDSERQVSAGLGLFTNNWNGSEVEQNIPAIYIIDAKGILRFKYISQNTLDRPEYDYLFKILGLIKNGKL